MRLRSGLNNWGEYLGPGSGLRVVEKVFRFRKNKGKSVLPLMRGILFIWLKQSNRGNTEEPHWLSSCTIRMLKFRSALKTDAEGSDYFRRQFHGVLESLKAFCVEGQS